MSKIIQKLKSYLVFFFVKPVMNHNKTEIKSSVGRKNTLDFFNTIIQQIIIT